ncbi:GDSL esterase/lipase [Canna indica]|uniref:GDSL esterase/lipase n=1 Tax=Canna indica TaxID=4628 RepID=A0AAQ3QI67_9LILI|nr:GDSL esterase/lipase [Canna indica]
MGLPLVPPYRAGNSSKDFKLGANFAVGGACALDNAFFTAKVSNVTWTDYSLNTQLKWFEQLLLRRFPSVHWSKAIVRKSLFFLGEMGVNDYTHLLREKNGRDTINTYVPAVVHAIGSLVNNLIHRGAKAVVVSGIIPMGCLPAFLTSFQTQIATEYDPKTGCLTWLNELAKSHNLQLQNELGRFRKVHPEVKIFYADYYYSMMPFFNNPERLGFKEAMVACCGGGGPYNFSLSAICGSPTSSLCSDPSSYVSWDGVHLTEAACSIVAREILRGFQR